MQNVYWCEENEQIMHAEKKKKKIARKFMCTHEILVQRDNYCQYVYVVIDISDIHKNCLATFIAIFFLLNFYSVICVNLIMKVTF